jgi:hypothetical protein
MAANGEQIVIRVNIPSLKLQKAIRINPSDYVWKLRNQLEEKVASEIKDILNYGVFLHGTGGKKGKFLDERNPIGSYHLDGNVKTLIYQESDRISSQMQNWGGIRPKKTKKDV